MLLPLLQNNLLTAGGNKIIVADAGSYAFTGAVASLELGRIVNAVAGSYTFTGLPANLLFNIVDGAVASYTSTAGSASDLSVYTFSAQPIGAAATNRKIVVAVSARDTGVATSLTGVTLGGNAMTVVQNVSSASTNETWSSLFEIDAGTGSALEGITSADVVVTFDAVKLRCYINVFTLKNVDAVFDSDSGIFASGSASSVSIDVPAWGVVVATIGGSINNIWTGLFEHSDAIGETSFGYSSASDLFSSAQTPLAISTTHGSSNENVIAAASWSKLVTSQTIVADAGSYTFTGTAADLEHGWKAIADAGSYIFTGTAVNLELDRIIVAGAGSYAFTGTAASLEHGWLIAAGAGSYLFTGSDVALTKSGGNKIITADAGAYAFTGMAADLEHALRIIAEAGSYVFTGSIASLIHGWEVNAEAGSYLFTGTDVTLTLSGAPPIGGTNRYWFGSPFMDRDGP